MTQVLTIQELQKLIPETYALEGQNFSDLKELINTIINTIEKTGAWEFVQYVQGKPSLFIVRQKEQKISDNPYNVSNQFTSAKTSKPSKNKNLDTKKYEEKVEENAVIETKNEEKLFPITKLPW